MNCYNIVIITFCLLFFNAAVRGGEVGEKNIGFIQDNKGRKWAVSKNMQNDNMFAQRDNEKVKVMCYIPLSKYRYVLYLVDGYTIKTNELISSEKSLEEAPTIYK